MIKRILAVFALLLALCPRLDAGIPEKPYPPRLVNDLAGVFPASSRDSLEEALVAYDRETSNQICVIAVNSLDGRDVAEYALRLGNEWGVGSSRNNGVVILLKSRGEDGYIDVTIQVGRGLEGAVPDAYAARIIRNIMGPKLRSDLYLPAVSDACAEIMALASGEISEPRDDSADEERELLIAVVMIALFFVLMVIAAKKGGGKGGPGSNSGGGGGGPIIFGSFGNLGGGGGFGGGGFGGFGGGSFGGGGASGRF